MSAEQIRSIGCGPIGAIVSAIIGSLIFKWQVKKWAHLVPVKFGTKGRADLLKEYQNSIRIAKGLSFAGICIGLLFYMSKWLNDHDWRGLGLGVGLMCFLPLSYMAASNMSGGTEAIKECLVAFAISEKTPTCVLFPFMALCIIAGLMSAISLLLRP